MKKKSLILITASLIGLAVIFSGFSGDKYIKIYESFEIYSEVLKTVLNYYVHEISPEKLTENSINGILKELDPYSVYYTKDETETLEILNNNRYVGFGVTITKIDNINTITKLTEGFSAHKAGLKIGDVLYKINGAEVINLSSDDLRNYTNGEINSIANVSVIRHKDTLNIEVERELIKLKDVTFYDILEGNIGYIYLEGFSKNAPVEVQNAINQMSKKVALDGLILDMRGNPGGLLYSAIAISELFVPKGSTIVYTKGKNGEIVKTYNSTQEPIYPDLPIAVMIDEGSASASEIVAGAIQDLDRGIVVGRNSFGKGLVQSVFNLPYDSYLKLTTSKYYTPSGRCIQKIDYSELKNDIPLDDTTSFFTKNGRRVVEAHGITPDSIYSDDEDASQYIEDLNSDNIIFKYADYFAANHQSITSSDTTSKYLLDDFNKFLVEKDLLNKIYLFKEFDDLMQTADNYDLDDKIKVQLKEIKNQILSQKSLYNSKNSEKLIKYIKYEVLRRYTDENSLAKYLVLHNKYILNTVELLKNKQKYNSILAIEILPKANRN